MVRAAPRAGFTLVELAVVLAVVSIMVAVIAPDFIEVARNDLAEAAAQEMVQLQDAAKWHYHNSYSGTSGDPRNATWPGQASPAACATNHAAISTCMTGGGGCVRMIPDSSLTNPWGQNYRFRVDDPSCTFIVATYVPPSVVGVLEAYLPGGECQGGATGIGALCRGTGPGAPAGSVKCCSIIPRPGLEASLNAWNPQITSRQCEESLGGVWTGGRCELFTQRSTSTCRTVRNSSGGSNDCRPGEVATGSSIECAGKYCSNPTITTECCQQQP